MNTPAPAQGYGEPVKPFGAVGITSDRGQHIATIVNGMLRDRFIAALNACGGMADPEREIAAMRERKDKLEAERDEANAQVLALRDALEFCVCPQPCKLAGNGSSLCSRCAALSAPPPPPVVAKSLYEQMRTELLMQRDQALLDCRKAEGAKDEAEKNAEDLAKAMKSILASAFPRPSEHPTMSAAWDTGKQALDTHEARKSLPASAPEFPNLNS